MVGGYSIELNLRKRFYSNHILVLKQDKINKINRQLKTKNNELSQALDDIDTLSGLIPICSHCKKIRDDKGYWNQIESYIQDHSKAKFSHGICQECAKKYYPKDV